MRGVWFAAVLCSAVLCAGLFPGRRWRRPGSISSTRISGWLGPDDKIIVERYDDPRVENVSCYMSRAETGGIKGGLGLAEDPSRFSIACRAVGPVTLPASMPRSEVIAFAQASLFFKTFSDSPVAGPGEARAGLYCREHETDQRVAVQQYQCGADGRAVGRRTIAHPFLG